MLPAPTLHKLLATLEQTVSRKNVKPARVNKKATTKKTSTTTTRNGQKPSQLSPRLPGVGLIALPSNFHFPLQNNASTAWEGYSVNSSSFLCVFSLFFFVVVLCLHVPLHATGTSGPQGPRLTPRFGNRFGVFGCWSYS